jgi:putative serine protease PepD
VRDADEVSVVLQDGTRRPARVLGRAPDLDLAVLELDDDSGLPPMHSGSGLAEARVGDPALAVGSPRGPAGAVTSGTIRALRAPVRLGRHSDLEALAIDAAIEPAQSGGPLVNARGEVLGVTTATAAARPGGASTSIGFAVPVDVARSASIQIVQGGRLTAARSTGIVTARAQPRGRADSPCCLSGSVSRNDTDDQGDALLRPSRDMTRGSETAR